MPLVSPTDWLRDAQKNGYALGAFNVENMEMAQAVIAAAEAERAPVMVQTTSGTLGYAPPEVFFGIVSQLARMASVPVAMHLDHGNSFDLAKRAIDAGYTSVMIDGSTLPYEENIALTRRVVEIAGDVPVEAELGTVGGKEDLHEASGVQYTDPAQASDFVARTGVTAFAVAIGTAHGVYKGEPKLDLDRLAQIRARVAVPLVLHGTSGVPDAQVRACIQRGICKVNYATELRIAFTEGVKEALTEQPGALDPKAYLKAGRAAVEKLVRARIALCGASGRA